MSLEKGLKMVGTGAGKVLTTDENGKTISTTTNVNDIATKDITNNLDSRITTLEGSVEEAVTLAKSING